MSAPNRAQRRGRRTMLGEARLGYLLVKEAFRRTVGVDSLPATLFATAVIVRELRRIAAPLGRARPKRPSFTDTVIAASVVRESARGIVGPQVRETPLAATIIGIGLLAPIALRIAASAAASGRMFRAALRGIRDALLPSAES